MQNSLLVRQLWLTCSEWQDTFAWEIQDTASEVFKPKVRCLFPNLRYNFFIKRIVTVVVFIITNWGAFETGFP